MEWKNLPGSGRGFNKSGGGRGGLVVGGIGGALLLLAAAFFGIDPSLLTSMGVVQTQPMGGGQVQETQYDDFIDRIAMSTNSVWNDIFAQNGSAYTQPNFRQFFGGVSTGCGEATSAVGPFYCPLDRTVYLDTSFFDQMQAQLGGGGDFAYAYVIAHEVGHHVQNELGLAEQVTRQQQRVSEAEANQLSVRLELQADCFAGVWGNHISDLASLTEADVGEAINTAAAIGDDHLQQQGRGYVQPESFTHGTSQQRVNWFMRGFRSGDAGSCDTFDQSYEAL